MSDLAAYAACEANSRGRVHREPKPALRGEFQRDRDRVIHSAAFRRLEYKTQVFVNHEGDMFRTRLTHSIEVAQIARTISRALGLNEDLTEAIALAHDLGHTPFGHSGQHVLNECMREFGGFEHNLQSLRVVDSLEHRYAGFHGLNLTFETREGILKRCSRARARKLGALGARFVEGGQPSLEAQVANIADEIAYNNHDVDDGLRSGLLSVEELQAVAGFRAAHAEVVGEWPGLSPRRAVHEVIRRMINFQVVALVSASRAAIDSAAPRDIDAVRAEKWALIRFEADARARHLELKRFLRRRLYRHPHVHRTALEMRRIVRELFQRYLDDVGALPGEARAGIEPTRARESKRRYARAVADYVAGMTDRFAIAEHQRLFGHGRQIATPSPGRSI